ncbi:MAG: S41 family peptidase [Terracidiphilus sp.]
MSEKIYSFLLRLYPARFRRQYGAEALQLFQDRLGDERGLLGKVHLWIDLLIDFASGLPLAYRNTYRTPTATQAWQAVAGLPAFRTLEEEPLRPLSVVMGSFVGIATLALVLFVMNHAAAFHPFPGSVGRLNAGTPGSESNPDAEAVAEKLERQIRSADQLQTCFFEKLERHPGNIGYVKLTWFADPASCGAIAEAVMQRLNETDAVIFDLRDTRGGYPEMVRWMAGWLFDRPVAWYNPRAASPEQLVTDSPVPGSRLANKPVFVLTSSRTFSGGEHFAYNLKILKRAMIVGETTSGASHAGTRSAPSQIAHVEAKPAWEGTGVQPDVRVDAADALRTAENLARSAIGKK